MAYEYDDMAGPLTESLAGPLVGGGVTQVGTLATKLIWKDNAAVSKWAASIGFGLGALVSGILAFRPTTRSIGIAGLVTSALMAIPRQLEDLMVEDEGATDGFGIITPETEMMGFGQAESPIELLGEGDYSNMGIITPEQGMGQAEGPVELLGNAGFGTNFLQ